MMKGRHVIFAILLLSSCELVTEVDVPALPPTLVINSLFHPDSTWTIFVSQQRHILENQAPPAPNNVMVSLTDENGQAVMLDGGFPFDDRSLFENYVVFKSTSKPVAGMSYTIKVSAPGFPDVEASATTPSVVELLDARLDSANLIPMNDYSSGSIPLEFTFQDPPGPGDHYILTFQVAMKYQHCNPYPNCQDVMRWQTGWLAETVEVEALAELSTNIVEILSDDLFDGKLRTVRLQAYRSFYSSNEPKSLPWRLYMVHVSDEYYKYIRSIRLQNETDGNPFAQPVQIQTNVTGGFGIFAGTSTSVWTEMGGN